MSDEFPQKVAQSQKFINTDHSGLHKALILFVLIFGFVSTFIMGYFLANLMSMEKTVSNNKEETEIPEIVENKDDDYPEIVQDSANFAPGKHYFNETIIFVSKNKPRINLVATVSTSKGDGDNFTQNMRVSFFDGEKWTRKSKSQNTKNSSITSNDLVRKWKVDIDPSRVLKQTLEGEVNVDKNEITFTSGTLSNEIGVRSLPGYTKFMSNGLGKMTVNGEILDAYVLYTHIYSLNSSEIQFYDNPFGLTTDWIAFWDSEDNFYHIDSTSVDKPTEIYQTHQIGILEDSFLNSVTKTFSTSIIRDSETPPVDYRVRLDSPINASLNFKRVNSLNKAPNGSYVWYMGNIEGSVQRQNGKTLDGVGLVEYIHN